MKTRVRILAGFICGVLTASITAQETRTERDLLGDKQIPANAYYGVQTARALENFQISGVTINHYPGFVEAWAIVKLAAAQANTDVGAMKPEKLAAIEKATQAVMRQGHRSCHRHRIFRRRPGPAPARRPDRDAAARPG